MTSQTEKHNRTDLDLSAYLELFLSEAETFLASLRQNLTQLLEHPTNGGALQEARRAAHTLRGMAGTMRFEELAALAKDLEHRLESELPPPPDQIRSLLAGCDEYESGLRQLETKPPGTGDRTP